MMRSETTGPPFCASPVWSSPRTRRPSARAAVPRICDAVTTPGPTHTEKAHRPTGGGGHDDGGEVPGPQGIGTGAVETNGGSAGPGQHGNEGGAVAVDAGVVLVARRLMDVCLRAELGLHGLDRQAVGLDAAVAAGLADPLVHEDPLGRVRQRAPLALAPLLRRALLVVHQHGDAGDGSEHLLGLDQPVPVPDLDTMGQMRAAQARRVLAGDDDPSHAFSQQQPRQVGDGPRPLDVLAAGHGHGRVVEDLVGDVDPGSDRRPHGQAAGVEERAVAQILEDVVLDAERRHAHPLRALAPHLRETEQRAHLFGLHQHGHAVAADAPAHQGALGDLDGTVVGAAGAEVWRPHHEREPCGRPMRRSFLLPPGQGVDRMVPGERSDQRVGDLIGRQLAAGREELVSDAVGLAHDVGPHGIRVQQIADLALDEWPFLLDHDHRLQPGRDLAHALSGRADRARRA